MAKKMTAAVKAKLAAYHRAHRKHAKKNPAGFGGAKLGRNSKGQFVKLNPRSAHEYGHVVGKYAKKGKRKAVAAYQGTRSFFGGLSEGWQKNPYNNGPMALMHNPYGASSLMAPMANPKGKRKSASKAARGRALAHSLARDSKGRFVKRNPHRRGHRYY